MMILSNFFSHLRKRTVILGKILFSTHLIRDFILHSLYCETCASNEFKKVNIFENLKKFEKWWFHSNLKKFEKMMFCGMCPLKIKFGKKHTRFKIDNESGSFSYSIFEKWRVEVSRMKMREPEPPFYIYSSLSSFSSRKNIVSNWLRNSLMKCNCDCLQRCCLEKLVDLRKLWMFTE